MSLSTLKDLLGGTRRHFSPFFMLGDPDPDLSFRICLAAIQAGASMLELGLPFSDPVADGPAVQAAGQRALASGSTIARALEVMARLRQETDAPFNLLVYGNLVERRGVEAFVAEVVARGASSLLVPDIPLEESGPLQAACASSGLGHVQLCGPASDAERMAALGRAATAFIYLVGHQGITGARADLLATTTALVARTRQNSNVPVAVGFGLKTADHVASVLRSGANIAVVGSALLERLASHRDQAGRFDQDALLADVSEQVGILSASAAAVSRELTGEEPCS